LGGVIPQGYLKKKEVIKMKEELQKPQVEEDAVVNVYGGDAGNGCSNNVCGLEW
jgi:hypothetical protein